MCLAQISSAEPGRPVSSSMAHGARSSLAHAAFSNSPPPPFPPVSRAHVCVLPVCGSCPSPLRLVRLASQDGALVLASEMLMMASHKGHSELVERLIAAGAKVDAANKVVPTPLPTPHPHHRCYCKAARARAGAPTRAAASLAQTQLHKQ
jgi:hypothetical protein